MNYKQSKAPKTTITRDLNQLTEKVGNVYETVAIIGKRSNQIANSLKKELNRFKYNESHYKAVLKKVEDFFRTMDSCRGYPPNTDIGKIANVAFKHWLYVESLEEKLRRR